VHFPSKELVLFEIIRAGHERALACVQDPSIDAAATAADRLRAIITRYTAWHARHHVAARVSQYELAGLTAEHYDVIIQLRHLTNEVFRGAVKRGIGEGAFAPADVNRIVRAILSLSIDLVRWYRLDGSDSPEQLGEFYAGLALKIVMHTVPAERVPPSSAGRRNSLAPGQPRIAAGE
jgi:AcrR family transcriptional regulator